MKKETLGNVLLIVVLAVFVLAFVVLPMASQSSRWYVVTSGSMEPTLQVGDVVYVSDAKPDEIAVGDVINFRRDSEAMTTTHRCIDVMQKDNRTLFKTKGDANEDNDSYLVSGEQLIGRVPTMELFGWTLYAKMPRLGYLSQFVHTMPGFFLLVMIPGYSLIGMEAYNIFNVLQSRPYRKNGYTLYRSKRGHYFFAKDSDKGKPVSLPNGYKIIISQKTGFPFLKRSNGHGELEMTMCLHCQGVFYYEKIDGANEVSCPFCGVRWQEIVQGPDT